MRTLYKEPLVHFLLIGACLFLLYEWTQPEQGGERDTIVISEYEVDRLVKSYEKNWNRKPDSLSFSKLIEEHIRSEVFYREALAMNLEHNDEIIKRRLRQKYEFLVKDLSEQQVPTTNELNTFYQNHLQRYQSERKLSFSQVYFSPDKRKNPQADAEKLQSKLKGTEPQTLTTYGDDFHLQAYYAKRTYRDLVQNYGKAFTDTLFSKTTLGWQTPISSGYGYHVIYLSDIEEAQTLDFEQVKNQVLEDWKQNELVNFNEELYRGLKNKYEVLHEYSL